MKVVWSPRSIRHLTTLRDYIAEEAAAIVAAKILDSVDRLASHPHSGRPSPITGTRELVVPGTPNVIPYRVRGERLDLIAVFHGKQKWPKHLWLPSRGPATNVKGGQSSRGDVQ